MAKNKGKLDVAENALETRISETLASLMLSMAVVGMADEFGLSKTLAALAGVRTILEQQKKESVRAKPRTPRQMGKLGGKARAAVLNPARRSEIARAGGLAAAEKRRAKLAAVKPKLRAGAVK